MARKAAAPRTTTAPPAWTERTLLSFREALLAWFDAGNRDLPWRRTRDPYAIWISEIMLQQTRVAAALPYYERFLRDFPTLRSLAAATDEAVFSRWSGLGYYSRARNLRRSAEVVSERHAGVFPAGLKEALALPGVGPYTAAAVLSIAYDAPLAALDGNVGRVLARLHRLEPPGDRARGTLQPLADRLLDVERPGAFNQAMMELGATVCTPRAPRCDACPVTQHCEGGRNGDAERYPSAKRKQTTVELSPFLFLLRTRREELVVERGAWRFLPELWIPPVIEPQSEEESAEEALPRALERTGLDADGWRASTPRALGTVRHQITHHRITLRVYAAMLAVGGPSSGRDRKDALHAAGVRLATTEEYAELGRSSIAFKALALAARSAAGAGLWTT